MSLEQGVHPQVFGVVRAGVGDFVQSDTGPAGVVVRHPPPLSAEKKGGAILSVYHGPTGFTGCIQRESSKSQLLPQMLYHIFLQKPGRKTKPFSDLDHSYGSHCRYSTLFCLFGISLSSPLSMNLIFRTPNRTTFEKFRNASLVR